MKFTPLSFFVIFTLNSSAGQAEITSAPPTEINVDRHYLFYLHGQIVEGSNGWPSSEFFGTYEYPKIVKALEDEGFWVISEIRRKSTNISQYANLISFYIDELKKGGVPSSRVTVVGASKGGIIASYVANKQQDQDLNFVILAGLPEALKHDPKMKLWGRVYSIHDKSDETKLDPKWFLSKRKSPGISAKKILITREQWGHSLIYKPRSVWLREVVAWSGIKKEAQD